jgi:pyrimidine operon attenuation protein/uracil phosphoribosyltransferase
MNQSNKMWGSQKKKNNNKKQKQKQKKTTMSNRIKSNQCILIDRVLYVQ